MKAGIPLFTVSSLPFPPVISEGLCFLFSLLCLHLSFITAMKVGGKRRRADQHKANLYGSVGRIKCHPLSPSTSPSLTHPPRCDVNMAYPPAHTLILTAFAGQSFQDGSDRQPIHPGLRQLFSLPLASPFWIKHSLLLKAPAYTFQLEMVPQQLLR